MMIKVMDQDNSDEGDNGNDHKGIYENDGYSDDDDDDDTKSGSIVTSNSRGQKRPHSANGAGSSVTDEEKKAERRAANRRSAFQSRQRRKILIEDLQRTVAALSKDNSELRKGNDDLRVQLEAALMENHQFRMQQQLSGVSSGPASIFQGQSSVLQQAQSAQAAALLRGGARGSAVSQLFGVGGGVQGAAGAGAGLGSTGADSDSLLNARIALASAHSQLGDVSQAQVAAAGSSLQGSAAGIQSFLESAARVGGGASATAQNAALKSFLDAAARNGGAGGQIAGLQSLLESAARSAAPGSSHGTSQLTDMQRAILQGASLQGNGIGQSTGSASNAGQDTMSSAAALNNGVSEALRNFFQKNQNP